MPEYRIGDRVSFMPDAEVSERVKRLTGVVEGYDAVGDEDFVMVCVNLNGKPTSQWVLPREIEPVTAHSGKGRFGEYSGEIARRQS